MLSALGVRAAFARLSRMFARLHRETSGVAAVEFAFVAPVLVLMLGGVVELGGAITASNRSTYVADAMAEMVSRVDHDLTSDELHNFAAATALLDPDVVRYAKLTGVDVEKAYKITISSVEFKRKILTCLVNCQYEANVVFSYTLNGTARSCGKLTSTAATAQTASTLPSDVFGPGSLVVVDVETFYRPIMRIRLAPTVSFKRSSYFRPRYISLVKSTSNCSGY